jgi:FKBP-type peptidyl-prolyl cis-trans isomerase
MMVMAVALMVLPAVAQEEPPVQLESEQAKLSYTLGAQIGRQLKMSGAEIDMPAFTRAITDALNEKELALGQDVMEQVMMEFQKQAQERMAKQQQEEAAANLAAGQTFLAEKKAQEGVKSTESGLMYEVLQAGTGEAPTADSLVKVHYTVASIDGEEYDSSITRGEPVEFPVSGGMIEGWTEALTMMKVGDKWRLYVPPSLAYGEAGRGSIPPNAALVFTVELLGIVESYEDVQATPEQPEAATEEVKEEVTAE